MSWLMTLEMFDTYMCQLHGVLHGLTIHSQAYQNKNNDATYICFIICLYYLFGF